MRRLPALLLLLLLPWVAHAGGFELGELGFDNVGDAEVIPNNNVTALDQDGEGFLWIGSTDGLIRYDGYRFLYHGHEADNPHSMGGDFVRCLLVSRDGLLWVGSNADGVSVGNPVSGRFMRLRHAAGDPATIPDDTVRALAEDGRGRIWIGTREGLARWLPEEHRIERLGPRFATEGRAEDEHITALLVAGDGTLWAGSWNGLSRLRGDGEAFERIGLASSGSDTAQGRMVQSLLELEDGRIAIGTAQHGSLLLDPASGDVQALPVDGDERDRSQTVLAMLQVSPSELWLGVFGGVDVVELPSGRLLRRIRPDPALPSGLAHDQIRSMLKDHAGQVWIGGYGGGLQRHDPGNRAIRVLRHSPSRPERLGSPSVSSVVELANGQLWIGTRGRGIDIFDRQRGRIAHIGSDGDAQHSLRGSVVSALAQTLDGSVWAGTTDALHRIDPIERSVQRFGTAEGLPNTYIRRLLADPDGGLWIGSDVGLARIDAGSVAIRVLGAVDGKAIREDINAIARAEDGRLWVGSSAGLYTVEPGGNALRKVLAEEAAQLPHPGILGLLVDARGWLWVDTPSGLARLLDFDGERARFESVSAGLGIAGRPFGANLLDDARGRIWTQHFVHDPASGSLHELTRADGADLGTPWFRSHARTRDGLLLFGGSKGLLVVDPAHYQPWTLQAPLVVSEWRIDGQVQHARMPPEGLTLQPGQRAFSVEFAALDYTAPQRIRYAYRLLGFEADWVEVGADQRLARYNSLRPGSYQLQIRGSNRSGLLGDGMLEIPVRVLPAWWQTWWFLVLALLAMAAVAWLALRSWAGSARRREERLRAMVAERTAELEQARDRAETALEQWQAAQRELLARERLASLGQLVAGVAHEINTPVGVALTAASYLHERSEQLRAQLQGGKLSKPDLEGYIDHAEQAAAMIGNNLQRASNLVRSFKQVSVDRSSDDRRRFNLEECLRSVVSSLELTWKRRAIQLALDCPQDIEIDSYPGALGQVVSNLIQNALLHGYGEDGSGTMHLSVERLPGGQLRLHFRDDGKGIRSEDLAQIFEPFFTTRRSQGGSGLGLHIVFNLVTVRLGGQIQAQGSPGAGLHFDIRLPERAPGD